VYVFVSLFVCGGMGMRVGCGNWNSGEGNVEEHLFST
jgi:hypothetical protein